MHNISIAPPETPVEFAKCLDRVRQNNTPSFGPTVMQQWEESISKAIRGCDGTIPLLQKEVEIGATIKTMASVFSTKSSVSKQEKVNVLRSLDCGKVAFEFLVGGLKGQQLCKLADASDDVDRCCAIATEWITSYEPKLLKQCKEGCDFEHFRLLGHTPSIMGFIMDVSCPFNPSWNPSTCISTAGAAVMCSVIMGPVSRLRETLIHDPVKAGQFDKVVRELGCLTPAISNFNMEAVRLVLNYIRDPLCGWRQQLCNQTCDFDVFGSNTIGLGLPGSDGDVVLRSTASSAGVSFAPKFQVDEDEAVLCRLFKSSNNNDFILDSIVALPDSIVPLLSLKIRVKAALLSVDYLEQMQPHAERCRQLMHQVGVDIPSLTSFQAVDAGGYVTVELDITYSNKLGVSNTELFRDSMLQVSEAYRPSLRGFFAFVSAFVKSHGICNAKSSAADSTLSSFAYRLIVMSMCIQMDVLPALREGMLDREPVLVEGMNLAYGMVTGYPPLSEVLPSQLYYNFASYMGAGVCDDVSEMRKRPRLLCQVLSKNIETATIIHNRMMDVAMTSRDDSKSDVDLNRLRYVMDQLVKARGVLVIDVDGVIAGVLEYSADGAPLTEDGEAGENVSEFTFNQRSNAETVVLNEDVMHWLLRILQQSQRCEALHWEVVVWSGRSDHLEGVIKRRMLEWFARHGMPGAKFQILFKTANSFQQTDRWKQEVMTQLTSVLQSGAEVLIVDDLITHLHGAMNGTYDRDCPVTSLLYTDGVLQRTSPSSFKILNIQPTTPLDAVRLVSNRIGSDVPMEHWNFDDPASTTANLLKWRHLSATQGGLFNVVLNGPMSPNLATAYRKTVLCSADYLCITKCCDDDFPVEPSAAPEAGASRVDHFAEHLRRSSPTAVHYLLIICNDLVRCPLRRGSLPKSCIDWLSVAHCEFGGEELDFGAIWSVLQTRSSSASCEQERRQVLQQAFEVLREVMQRSLKWIKRSAKCGTRSRSGSLLRTSECTNLHHLDLPGIPVPAKQPSVSQGGLASALAALNRCKIKSISTAFMTEVLETVLCAERTVDEEHIQRVASTIIEHLSGASSGETHERDRCGTTEAEAMLQLYHSL